MNGGPLDLVPIWAVFPITVLVVMLSVEGGYRLGQRRRHHAAREDRPPLGEMVAATLGLLAFMLGFTFSLVSGWFDARRKLVVDEANAIGTAYLRAGLLDDPYKEDVRDLLRDYVAIRVRAADPGRLVASVRESEALHSLLWDQAEAVGKGQPGSITIGLFIQAVNDVIDLHSKRVALGVRTRLPSTLWLALFFLAIIGTAVIGYHSGLAGSGRSLALVAVVLGFAITIALIADLDRPQEGWLRVSQQALIDVQRSMGPSKP